MDEMSGLSLHMIANLAKQNDLVMCKTNETIDAILEAGNFVIRTAIAGTEQKRELKAKFKGLLRMVEDVQKLVSWDREKVCEVCGADSQSLKQKVDVSLYCTSCGLVE
jgi:hypothetical protein